MKKKISILINSDLYVRNYLESGAFKKIFKKFDVNLILSENEVFNKKKVFSFFDKKKIKNIRYSQSELKKFNKYLLKNFFLNKRKSKTTDYIIKQYLNKKFHWDGENMLKTFCLFPLRLLVWIKKNLEYFISLILKKNVYRNKINSNLKDILKKINPDLIIFPYQDAHILNFDIIKGNYSNLTMGLTDNWDNLSSRAQFDIKPSYITVWGEQTKQHAIKFHHFRKDKIFSIGTPRFSSYFADRNKNINSNFKFPYFLFLESFNNYDNFFLIKKLEDYIGRNKIFSNYKIIYRPHPWQKKNIKILNEKKFKNLIIDPQLRTNYIKRNFSRAFQPNLKYYSSLIKNSKLVITGPTSMLIEASIFYKKILLLGHQNNSSSPYNLELENYEHLKNVKRFPNLIINKDINEFTKDLDKVYKIKIDKKKINKIRNYYYNYSGEKYQDRIYKVVKKILNV
tara:strand:- start:346 stop:1704 length:1359 start_codon:yes stop_codon:yes gene_type:complete